MALADMLSSSLTTDEEEEGSSSYGVCVILMDRGVRRRKSQ